MRSQERRIIEIKTAVDELLRRLNHWIGERSNPVMPEAVSVALRNAAIICGQGEIPESCRAVNLAISRLAEEFRGYSNRELGKVRLESGAPGPSFWAAAKEVARARQQADAPLIERLEPVSVLLAQGVSHDQIARQIYGRRGVGPFLQLNGTPDVGLIEKEAKEPGSVIPADWVPPWQADAVAARAKSLQTLIAAFDRLETGRRYDDPATVEEMLRDGAFVQQIERAKGGTREAVLEAAKRIGVNPVDGPGYRPAPSFAPVAGEPLNDVGDDDAGPGSNSTAADKTALRDMVIEVYTRSNETRGAAEIADELRQAGYDINTQMVSATIGHYRKRQKADAAQTATA